MKNKFLITIVGPTAIGKTALSIYIAQQLQCEIISCDSRQFFKEMSIGTAVPSTEELNAVKHHFIHNKSIFDNYTVGDFEREAITKLEELFQHHDYAVMVGGSGLYVDAVIKGFDDFPDVPTEVRAQIISDYESKGIEYLQSELQTLDPDHYAIVAQQNPQRLMRALEICIATGKPYSSFLNQKKNIRNFSSIKIGLDADRPIIYNRINQRVDIMLNQGLLEEAKALYPHKALNALQTVGYRELFSYFDTEISLEFAIEEIKKNTRRFSKRQLTWFKRDEDTQWYDIATPKEIIMTYIKSKSKQ
ncbi:tRNA (adenosine(37)-N6)-dimethylallyltransferase MiaA [Flavobacterium sp. '19STA2R22 D10 B1']|uniref:tRNA (adenosine(37)-N6)-dimethylallyltransferase MiaA n=1 Tax=Flavobacterium aerium TaxID=3037261 RepID=UPI00278BCECD|nr:tRNA (adenosine(37)-N6)-dimethylallyltransferase MiaA [Flavobacterium sp. '19STA2R22 D10 B1']